MYGLIRRGDQLKKAQLKQECRRLGLHVSGNQQTLRERIRSAHEAVSVSSQEERELELEPSSTGLHSIQHAQAQESIPQPQTTLKRKASPAQLEQKAQTSGRMDVDVDVVATNGTTNGLHAESPGAAIQVSSDSESPGLQESMPPAPKKAKRSASDPVLDESGDVIPVRTLVQTEDKRITLPLLKGELRQLSLKVSGSKAELIHRLAVHYGFVEESEEAEREPEGEEKAPKRSVRVRQSDKKTKKKAASASAASTSTSTSTRETKSKTIAVRLRGTSAQRVVSDGYESDPDSVIYRVRHSHGQVRSSVGMCVYQYPRVLMCALHLLCTCIAAHAGRAARRLQGGWAGG